MISELIKNEALLAEDYRSDDLFESVNQKQAIARRINGVRSSSTLAIVGRFGSGKSTILYQLEKEKAPDEVWLHFDAWKYPDRKDLWEGLVLDIADQLGKQKSTKKRIEGSSGKGGKVFDVVTDIATVASGIPGLNILDKLVGVFKSSPAKRVFEIQEILHDLLSVGGGLKIRIVIEDIDRSGDAGVYFLETLNHFLKNTDLANDVIAVVPISDTSYKKQLPSYLKCIDYFEFFTQPVKSMTKFVAEVFNDSLFEGELIQSNRTIWTGINKRGQLENFLEMLFVKYPEMNGRLLKLIIRDFVATYSMQKEDQLNPDWRITLCVQASKYLKQEDSSSEETAFKRFLSQGQVPANSIFGAYLFAMYTNHSSITENDPNNPHSLVKSPFGFRMFPRHTEEDHPSYPWQYREFGGKMGFGICDFYFKY